VNFPNDAVGATTAIKGGIVIDTAGKVVPAESRLVIDVATLKSDQEGRDRQVMSRILDSARFPTVEVGVTELRGLRYPWPATGELKFELVGDLKIQGVTKPWTWQVTAAPKDGGLAGRATTAFKFGDFGMAVPTSFRLLSVEDNVRLEYDFHFTRAPAK
jgi:polyisoprenoid-binding protein YceI